MTNRRVLRLVCYAGDWQVCERQEVIDEDGRRALAWINNGKVFCLVSKEAYVFALPPVESSNFFGDRFTFAVDRKSIHLDLWEKCAGADNAIAARRAFEAFVQESNDNTIVRLRHGARIMREATGEPDRKP